MQNWRIFGYATFKKCLCKKLELALEDETSNNTEIVVADVSSVTSNVD